MALSPRTVTLVFILVAGGKVSQPRRLLLELEHAGGDLSVTRRRNASSWSAQRGFGGVTMAG